MGGSVTLNPEMHDASQEVLGTSGCETFMGNKCQVGLQRNNGAQAAPLSSTTVAGIAKNPLPPRLSATKLSPGSAPKDMCRSGRGDGYTMALQSKLSMFSYWSCDA
ncbi:hypothetical protein KC318_g3357 [Hortaea werneckii]|nr:hypothetical protein KC334_g1021 [Hortaea werneckii]KAI7026419.1 hypothetical protein KC355_g670 [Hortaea werneckii]KAI7203482.1 hypothetical protein KC324_g1233 [Hortaea werneckii]KAI7583296.1 hypothetical protein KC316_g7364 [Hortaea werneckii]KAI7671676.1 hypothetical protein KC318_g3357 [Hortaea werneckii]